MEKQTTKKTIPVKPRKPCVGKTISTREAKQKKKQQKNQVAEIIK